MCYSKNMERVQKQNLNNSKTDEYFMGIAIDLSKKASRKGEVPIGALIVLDGKIIAKAYNKKELRGDATAHAEILAIRKASKKYKDFRLEKATIYVSLEPCVMCMGAILSARIPRLVFGAFQDKPNILGSDEINDRAGLNHKCEIVGGVLGVEAKEIISEYFKGKRKKQK